MKKSLIFLFLLLSIVGRSQEVTRVLFVGNSITYFNDLPQTFESIANSLGDSTEVTVYAPGGTGFINHVSDAAVNNHFKQGNWDYIVLQPGSNESPGYSFPISETLERAKMLNDSIYKYNTCAKVLYYEISYGVWGNSASDLVTYNTTMDLIKENIQYLSDSTSAFMAPVGEAFRTSWNANLNNMLWGGTGDIHPNPKGSYLAACTFYASIFQKPSLGTSVVNGMPITEASDYQHLADSVVLNHLPEWRINTYHLYSDFSYNLMGDSVFFTNLSLNTDSVFWDFGNGAFSNELNPVHTYSTNGSYNATLTTYKGECTDTISKTIEVFGLEINEHLNEHSFYIYPNPANSILNINTQTAEGNQYTILNALGQVITSSKIPQISVSQLKNGIYYLQITSQKTGQIHTLRWIKE